MIAFILDNESAEIRSKLEEIYLRYHIEMYFKAFQILKHPQDSQDVVQETILKLAKYVHKIEDVESYKTKGLVHMIVRNYAIDIYRHKQKNSYVLIDEFENELMNEDISLEDLMIKICEAEWLAKKIAELNPDYADVLTLKYYSEFSDLEIADLLNISYDNVRTRLKRAKKALLILMESKNEAVI